MAWTPFMRQLFLCSGTWTVYFMHGLCIGFPTVLVPQLRKANQTISIEQSSWLMVLHSYFGIIWVFVLSALIVVIGRKKSYIIVCISTLITFLIFYFSTNINHFYFGAIFQGALTSSFLSTNIVILTECISSKHRGIFLTIKSATAFWGILVANAIGTFFHWQNIVILGLVCSVYTLLNVIIWPESPLWLATKGRFVECSAAHRWLKGDDEESEKELEKMIKSHENRAYFVNQQWSVRYLFTTIRCKQFWKPILLANLLVSIYCFSGKLVCTVYSIDILTNITDSESAAYSGMLILDGVTVACMYLGCLLTKFFKRRLILIGFSSLGITIMIFISIYLYLAKLSVIHENKYISISFLVAYSVAISGGPMMMSTTMIGELLPLKSRILSLCVIALTFKATHGSFIKISPLCFKNLGIHGTFALYAVLSTIVLVPIYFYVPETKDKTLQDIDDYMKAGKKTIIGENNELIKLNN